MICLADHADPLSFVGENVCCSFLGGETKESNAVHRRCDVLPPHHIKKNPLLHSEST